MIGGSMTYFLYHTVPLFVKVVISERAANEEMERCWLHCRETERCWRTSPSK
ncbi:hypothetical protein RchiOBHm_Chr4g0385441 [Rosa chinensis]|uniref:Uncharacterized protein n=1 Tax=Rosa chinensis TaxID=74649 RepID=A0A2P6QNY5_ROSCH|nr:hypothetical protein RchiOBHm_Chr4g0385441 [Rosa chinensis]